MREQRTLQLDSVIIRAEPGGRFEGHASTFGRFAYGDPLRFGWWEQMSKSAFDRVISEDQDVGLFVDHRVEASALLARTTSGTMSLSVDKKGLLVKADLADTTAGRDLRVSLERRDITAMSIGFIVRKDEWADQKDGSSLRTIHDIDLFDVSAVAFPANPETDAQLRSMAEAAGLADARRRRWEETSRRFEQIRAPRGY